MDSAQFDTITRALCSRRTALTGLLGGVAALRGLVTPDSATAHNLLSNCRKIADPVKRRKCLRRARAHKRSHICRSEAPALTCGARCGIRANNCGQAVTCATCPELKACLANGSCAIACSGPTCPAGCSCVPELVEGGKACVSNSAGSCAQIPMGCSATTDCPVGYGCILLCGGPLPDWPGRCAPLCQV